MTTTDLRAALRDAIDMIPTPGGGDAEHDRMLRIEQLRDLADAPPTVAELLADPGFLAGTHKIEVAHPSIPGNAVQWLAIVNGVMMENWRCDDDEERDILRRWDWPSLGAADLTAPARLVEVTP